MKTPRLSVESMLLITIQKFHIVRNSDVRVRSHLAIHENLLSKRLQLFLVRVSEPSVVGRLTRK